MLMEPPLAKPLLFSMGSFPMASMTSPIFVLLVLCGLSLVAWLVPRLLSKARRRKDMALLSPMDISAAVAENAGTTAILKTSHAAYTHGGGNGAAAEMLQNPFLVELLRDLCPAAYERVALYVEGCVKLRGHPPSPLVLMDLLENSPVVAAFFTIQCLRDREREREMQESDWAAATPAARHRSFASQTVGTLSSGGSSPRVPPSTSPRMCSAAHNPVVLEWDIHLDPHLCKRIDKLLREEREREKESTHGHQVLLQHQDGSAGSAAPAATGLSAELSPSMARLRMQCAEELVSSACISHGSLIQTACERWLNMPVHAQVLKSSGGVTPRLWLRAYFYCMQTLLGREKLLELLRGGSTVSSGGNGGSAVAAAALPQARPPILSVFLDVKSMQASADCFCLLAEGLNALGVHVWGLGSFKHEQLFLLGRRKQVISLPADLATLPFLNVEPTHRQEDKATAEEQQREKGSVAGQQLKEQLLSESSSSTVSTGSPLSLHSSAQSEDSGSSRGSIAGDSSDPTASSSAHTSSRSTKRLLSPGRQRGRSASGAAEALSTSRTSSAATSSTSAAGPGLAEIAAFSPVKTGQGGAGQATEVAAAAARSSTPATSFSRARQQKRGSSEGGRGNKLPSSPLARSAAANRKETGGDSGDVQKAGGVVELLPERQSTAPAAASIAAQGAPPLTSPHSIAAEHSSIDHIAPLSRPAAGGTMSHNSSVPFLAPPLRRAALSPLQISPFLRGAAAPVAGAARLLTPSSAAALVSAVAPSVPATPLSSALAHAAGSAGKFQPAAVLPPALPIYLCVNAGALQGRVLGQIKQQAQAALAAGGKLAAAERSIPAGATVLFNGSSLLRELVEEERQGRVAIVLPPSLRGKGPPVSPASSSSNSGGGRVLARSAAEDGEGQAVTTAAPRWPCCVDWQVTAELCILSRMHGGLQLGVYAQESRMDPVAIELLLGLAEMSQEEVLQAAREERRRGQMRGDFIASPAAVASAASAPGEQSSSSSTGPSAASLPLFPYGFSYSNLPGVASVDVWRQQWRLQQLLQQQGKDSKAIATPRSLLGRAFAAEAEGSAGEASAASTATAAAASPPMPDLPVQLGIGLQSFVKMLVWPEWKLQGWLRDTHEQRLAGEWKKEQ